MQHVQREGMTVEEADGPITASNYIIEHGFRLVIPYHFDFKCFVKKRMVGKTVIDVFTEHCRSSRPGAGSIIPKPSGTGACV